MRAVALFSWATVQCSSTCQWIGGWRERVTAVKLDVKGDHPKKAYLAVMTPFVTLKTPEQAHMVRKTATPVQEGEQRMSQYLRLPFLKQYKVYLFKNNSNLYL